MEEKVCCKEVEKTANEILKENDAIIFDINNFAKEIESNIFGEQTRKTENNERTCLIQLLEDENHTLRETANILARVKNTLIAK